MAEERPQFTGITTYQDPAGRFSFRYPWDWAAQELDEDREGVLLAPEPDDPDTYFAAWPSNLPTSITAEDLDHLKAGFDEGLTTLPDLTVLSAADDTFGNMIRLDRLVTFGNGTTTCQRRVWAIYADRMQLIIIFQGSTTDKYAYWLPMGNYCYATFELPEATWFATDPDLNPRPDQTLRN